MKLKEATEDTVKQEIFAMLSKSEKDEDTLAELKRELEDSFEDDEGESFTFKFDGTEYKGYYSEEDAEKAAKQDIIDMIDTEGPMIMNKDFIMDFMYVGPVDIRIMSGEEAEARLDGMDTEDIVREAGMEDEYEAVSSELDEKEIALMDEEDPEKEVELKDQIEKLKRKQSKIISDARDELIDTYQKDIADQLEKDPIAYFEEMGGQEMVDHMIEKGFLNVDEREAAKAAVSMDGWAHTLSRYSGDYETTPSGSVFFRE